MAVLGESVTGVRKLGLLAGPFARRSGLRVGCRALRCVSAALAMEIDIAVTASAACRRLAVGALGALFAALTSLVYLHLTPSGLSPLHHLVSYYGITCSRAGYRAATISLGSAAAATAIGLQAALADNGGGRRVALLVVFAVARMIISWVPMDAPQASPPSTGQRRRWLAIVTFGAVTLAALRLGQILARGARWQALAPVATACGWAMVACVFALLLNRQSRWLRRHFGAAERLLYLAISARLTVSAAVPTWCVP